MSVEARTTIDDDLDKEVLIWTFKHCGTGKSACSEYVRRALRSQAVRDRGMWEKSHPVGSSPLDGREKSQG